MSKDPKTLNLLARARRQEAAWLLAAWCREALSAEARFRVLGSLGLGDAV